MIFWMPYMVDDMVRVYTVRDLSIPDEAQVMLRMSRRRSHEITVRSEGYV